MISQGLGRQGALVTQGLNPRFTQVVPRGELAEVKVDVLADGTVVLFSIEGKVFEPDESSFHPDDGDCYPDAPMTEETGLDPQPDPEILRGPDTPAQEPADCAPDGPTTPETGLDPQPDPERAFHAEESRYAPPEGASAEGSVTEGTGVDPQVDPSRVRPPDESTSHRADGKADSPTTPPTGDDPLPDPPHEFEDKESGSEGEGVME